MSEIITLMTDFGMTDRYVGAMKGVILSIAPRATLVDITHEIPQGDIRRAAEVLRGVYPYYPPHTVHLIVVDPGVGTARQAVALQTPCGRFVAPNNGVLSYILMENSPSPLPISPLGRGKAVNLTNPTYWRAEVSHVFHGRDIFSPVAAHLSNGVAITDLGDELDIAELVKFPISTPREHEDGSLTAHVVHIDHFGNITTDVPASLLAGHEWVIEVAGRRIRGIRRIFGDVGEGELVALVNSDGYLDISVRNGSAARELEVTRANELKLRRIIE